MKSYFQIQIPSISLAGNRGAPPDPAGTDSSRHSKGRLPGPVGGDRWKPSEIRFIEETIRGGSIPLELDNKSQAWRIKPPAFANWRYYLPATHGKWARTGNEITILDAINREIYF